MKEDVVFLDITSKANNKNNGSIEDDAGFDVQVDTYVEEPALVTLSSSLRRSSKTIRAP